MKVASKLLVVLILGALTAGTRGGEKNDRPLDKDFLVKVATCNNAEIEISKLADKRSNSSQVKDFATMLQKDHKAAQEKLGDLLKSRKFGVATGLEKESRDEIKRLSGLDGKEFDRAFLQHAITEHKKAISIFENQAKNGKEADVRDYAKDLLPGLQKHLTKAEDLAKTAGK